MLMVMTMCTARYQNYMYFRREERCSLRTTYKKRKRTATIENAEQPK